MQAAKCHLRALLESHADEGMLAFVLDAEHEIPVEIRDQTSRAHKCEGGCMFQQLVTTYTIYHYILLQYTIIAAGYLTGHGGRQASHANPGMKQAQCYVADCQICGHTKTQSAGCSVLWTQQPKAGVPRGEDVCVCVEM